MPNAELERCAHCGADLPDDQWCPVVTRTANDGTVQIRSFCDETCKSAWLSDGSTEAGEDSTES